LRFRSNVNTLYRKRVANIIKYTAASVHFRTFDIRSYTKNNLNLNTFAQKHADHAIYKLVFYPYRKYWLGIALGLLAFLFKRIFSANPSLAENLYSRGLFLLVRSLIDYLLAWLPIPLIYLFCIFIAYYLISSIRKWWIKEFATIAERMLAAALGVLAFVGVGFFLFLFMWGFNYSRLSMEHQLGLELEPLSLEELKSVFYEETEELKKLRKAIPNADTDPISASDFPEDMEDILREQLEGWLAMHGFSTVGRVRGRYVLPKGIFLRFSSSGLYFPFTGEGHVDAGLHPLQRSPVMAHELAHGYGFGDEGTCNFLAYVSAENSKHPAIAYAAHLSFWRTLAVNYLKYEPEIYREFRESLPLGIQSDLDAINEVLKRYPDIMPKLRYYAYDAYLKAQGIDEGIKNYNRVVMMVKAWRESKRI
jgi:hypothetical protein